MRSNHIEEAAEGVESPFQLLPLDLDHVGSPWQQASA
jgi:hypothetical protein